MTELPALSLAAWVLTGCALCPADFLDSWKIGSSDPVWQTLDMNASSGGAVVPASPINGSMFVF